MIVFGGAVPAGTFRCSRPTFLLLGETPLDLHPPHIPRALLDNLADTVPGPGDAWPTSCCFRLRRPLCPVVVFRVETPLRKWIAGRGTDRGAAERAEPRVKPGRAGDCSPAHVCIDAAVRLSSACREAYPAATVSRSIYSVNLKINTGRFF